MENAVNDARQVPMDGACWDAQDLNALNRQPAVPGFIPFSLRLILVGRAVDLDR
jgi:hypothetical protein